MYIHTYQDSTVGISCVMLYACHGSECHIRMYISMNAFYEIIADNFLCICTYVYTYVVYNFIMRKFDMGLT